MLQAEGLKAQIDTVHFANWEAHTRGIGSKLMIGMGFRRDQGLGRTLTGSQAPLEVRLSPYCLTALVGKLMILTIIPLARGPLGGAWQHQFQQ